MARLAIIGALLMFLLVLTEASIYRTIITTEVNDQPEMCESQLRTTQMNSCMRYLQPNPTAFPRIDVEQQCCQELGQVSRDCRCEAVRQIVQSITGFQGGQHQQMEKVIRTAQQLPNTCGMEPQYCKIKQQGHDEQDTQQSQMCQSQLSQAKMDSCMQYLQPYQMVFPSIDVQQVQQQCCQELGQVNRDCRCEAVRQIVQTISESQGSKRQGKGQQQQMEKVIKTAQQLPNMCGMEPQYCQIQQQGCGGQDTQQSEMCQSQLSRAKMDSCMRYLQPYMLLPRVDVSRAQQQCCQELRKMSPDCRCEAIRQTVQTITGSQGDQQQGEEQQQQMEKVMRTAEQLPNMCGMEPQHST